MGSPGDQDIDDTLTSPSPPGRAKTDHGLPSELLGRYALQDELGSGGGGCVYLAFDRELERHVAIKVLRNTPAGRSDVLSTRLRREAQANALLQHPNVVSVFDVGDHDGEVFIAMEYVDGGSLAEWLRTSRDRRAILETFLQAGRGLLAAHHKGIIHRDFKPSNVLIGKDGRVRVADFGLARGVGAEGLDAPYAEDAPVSPSPGLVDRSLTKTGTVLGTPAYMAPEQFRGRMVDARADQFSFCLVLAEALTGSKAPRGDLTTEGWRTTDLDPKSWLRAYSLPPGIRDVLIKGLSAEAEDRFDSLQPVLNALRHEVEGDRRPQILAVGLGVAVVALVAAMPFVVGRSSPCAGLSAPFDDVWNDARRSGFEAHLNAATPDGRREVIGALDRYGAQWTQARIAVCRATHVQKEQSGDLLDVRMGCLDRRLQDVRRFLALVDSGRLAGVGPTSEAILRLESPKSCQSARKRSEQARLPPDPKNAKTVQRATRQLNEVRTLCVAGLSREGLEKAKRAVELAEASRHAPTQAAAYEWLGTLLQDNDRFREATAAFEKTQLLADAVADDALRLEALVALIRLDDGTPQFAAQTDRNVAQARALLVRQNGTALQQAVVSAALGRLHYRRGDLVACRQHGEQAMLYLEQASDSPLFTRLEVSEDLALCLERLGLRREAAQVLQKTLATALEQLGPTHPRVGRLNLRLSRALDFSGDRLGAQKAAQRAVEILSSTLGEEHSETAAAYQALANVLFREGDYDGSRRYLQRAIDVLSKIYGPRSHQAGGLLSSLALSESLAGAHDEAHQHHEQSVAIFKETLGLEHPMTAAAIGRMGSNLRAQGDCETALRYCRQAMLLLRKSDPEHARILDQVRCLGACLLDLGRPERAIKPLEAGLALSRRRDEPVVYTARLEFLAARALWATGARRRATHLAQSARARLEGKPHHAKDRTAIDEWLSHRIAAPGATSDVTR